MNRMRTAAIVSLALAAALLAAPTAAGAAQGSGNPVLTVAPMQLTAGRSATVTVTGTDYLVPPHAPGVSVFGGVYVFFGWVRPGGTWGPSTRNSNNNDGTFGVTYSYRGDGGDASTRDDGSGTMRFVSFTPGGTSGDATDFHMDDNGNWSATLNIPGATYKYEAANGATKTVNCRQLQCGVFTIGAHGKASSTNERFTPITFLAPPTPTTAPHTPPTGGGITPTTGLHATPTTAPGVPVGPAVTAPNGSGATTATTHPKGASGATGTSGPSSTTRGSTSTTAAKSSGSADDAGAGGNRAAGESISSEGTAAVSSASGSATPWIVAGVVALLAIGAGAGLWFRRRQLTPPA